MRPNREPLRTKGWLLAAVLLPVATGCRPPAAPAPSGAHEGPKAHAVRVITPGPVAIRRKVSQPGAVEAFEETPVFAKVSGYVRAWHVDRGDEVDTGQLLAELSVPELKVKRELKKSRIEQATEEIAQARQAVAVAKAAFESARARVKEMEAGQERAVAERKRTKSQYERLTRAGEGGVIAKESVEETRLGYEAAEAGLRQAEAAVRSAEAARDENKAKWDKTLADVRVAEAKREVARNERDYVQARFDYTRVTAPYPGIITARSINRGDFVRTAAAGQGKPLYVVQRMDKVRIVVQVPETDADWVRKGATAKVRIQAPRDETLSAPVARISWALEPVTRTLRAEIDLPNPGGRLRPGTYAYATLTADHAAARTLPRSAVATEGDVLRGYQAYCFVVEDGKARRLPVQLGPGDGERVEVLGKQTRAGGPWEPMAGTEQVIAGNLSDVRDGQAVTIRPAGKQPND